MSAVLERPVERIEAWRSVPPQDVAPLLGEVPAGLRLDRVHFPSRRPVQLTYAATLRSGETRTLFAEDCGTGTMLHASEVAASLRKSRHGQRAGLTRAAILADEVLGLVWRQPGLDERLSGLRLLYDAEGARRVVAELTGCDPGQVTVDLVAHRLGKRAVLRIGTGQGDLYARLSVVKGGEGGGRLARHAALWRALGPDAALRIPQPLGASPDLGVALFSALPGQPAAFGRNGAEAIARALETLRGLGVEDLPKHGGSDEAKLLEEWLGRCRVYLPDLAERLETPVAKACDALARSDTEFVLCHRDLHEKQILLAGGVAGILDFDTLSRAHPALDPGNLLAHLCLAGVDERPLRAALDLRGIGLWRSAALLRLAMIRAFTSAPAAAVRRLIDEAAA
ncbi:aminoglycoside phosphotransferase family protein [Silicimonas algicola]|uniref:Phosphotransferase family enzyme n=1 Tax=Silicimonas algicola TaxID=1826607 RepID=A0A316G103_9RHOB|nr:aminoglycoside phosphotransferase family protein [Silicimonas algicola]AZQ68234.1 aminoglycoside phosphotransferase family protein [Silicimonas algicola]PWK54634.1 phosphotransferase family enzyme [Silicimonas algicola]